jgi:hypothetical protein
MYNEQLSLPMAIDRLIEIVAADRENINLSGGC